MCDKVFDDFRSQASRYEATLAQAIGSRVIALARLPTKNNGMEYWQNELATPLSSRLADRMTPPR